ncbi:hypothetical protein COEREDRAFT_97432 [Coemansia reversa NRRL 1564]|uniref:Rpr2-domain-containing protein n=1 Tax=Coemansia reversa (strain ATCC 12441 / NRRL 1564) TaxID=763665 RepID=A0A2G5BC47_COERN|nr:hypothetical protein COEREDRAFT_97432 [Coemansia reversa NRRL 1564]|eukprot:PIA16572.1 hypothetical protein COEREDRAFT_97432 [Coemansia reversa NRRL 1564]
MAPIPSKEQNDLRLNFLHSATHAAFKVCPQLAGFYGDIFLSALGTQRVSNSIQRQLCVYCGSPLVDGCSVSRVSVIKNTPKKKPRLAPRAARDKDSHGDLRLKVVRIKPNDALSRADGSGLSHEQRLAQLRNQRNTVQYTCGMCRTRIVYPGATKSGLRAAGLDGKPGRLNIPDKAIKTTESVSELVGSASARDIAPSFTASAAQPSGGSGGPDCKTSAGNDGGAAIKKRKRHKSNLLAAVAANRKKAEEKTASSSGFSLDDFLSGSESTSIECSSSLSSTKQTQIREELDGLPKPSTMPAAQMEQPTSLVSTVFGSQTAGSVNILGGHITERVNHQALAPVPADASAIDCEYYHISKGSLQERQSESQKDLGIMPNYLPVTSAVATSTEHQTKAWNNTVQPLSAIKTEKKSSATSFTYDGSDTEEIDLSSISAVPMDPTTKSIANTTVTTAAKTLSATTLKDEKPGHKKAKKGKHSKKNRG